MLYTTFVGGAERSPEGIGTADVKTREPVPSTKFPPCGEVVISSGP